MKLKTFGLIEAILGSALLIIFLVAMALISTKSSESVNDSLSQESAEVIAEDFIGRVALLRDTGRINFTSDDSDGQVIPVDCFSTEKGESCRGQIMDAYPQNIFPYFDMISDKSLGSYKLIKKDYLSAKQISDKEYKIKVIMGKASCGVRECKEIYLEVYWDDQGAAKTYTVKRLLRAL